MGVVTKEQVKELIIEVFEEHPEKIHPIDNQTMFLYRLTGDFNDFKGEVRRQFNSMEDRFDAVDARLGNIESTMVTKDALEEHLKEGLKDLVTKDELKESLKDLVTKDELKDSLKNMVTNDALNDALNKSLKNMVTNDALNNALSELNENMKDMVTKIGVSMRGLFQEEFDKRAK